MPEHWSVPQHADVLDRLAAAVATRPGAVVTGPDGIGKSTLVHQAAARYTEAHPGVVLRIVTGTPTECAVPFGAFAHLVDIAEMGKPAALLRAARDSLRAEADDLLIVDDANQLDPLSATLVYQLALAGETRMIVTAREDDAPAAVRALWTDALLPRIDVAQPTTDTTDTSAEKAEAFLSRAPAEVRAVLDHLSQQEPIPFEDAVALTSETAVRDAERLGVIEVLPRAGTQMVFTTHPLFALRSAAALGADERRRIRGALARAAAARARNHPSDRLRVAGLAVDSDHPPPVDQTVADADAALRLGDLALAERLARSAVMRGDALRARLVLAHALSWQGRGRDAAEVLAAVDPGGLSDGDVMAWALPRAANQFWMLGEPEQATAFLRNTRSRLSEPSAQTTIDALTATFAMNAGAPQRALRIAETVLSSPTADDTAVAWAASAAALSSARIGRLAEVESFARRASAVEHPGLLRFTVGLAQCTALIMGGDLDGAEAVAQRYTDFAELQQPGRAIGEVLLANVALAKGDSAAAAELLGPAAAALERTGYSWGPLALMLSATATAQLGDLPGAAKTLARAESRHGTKSALFAPELGIARAWRLAAGRDQHGAVAAARQAAGMAERSGQAAVAVRCWYESVRLGDPRAAEALERIAPTVDSALTDRALTEARAVQRDR
ncbi:AAA family ATPase [Mycobacterium sp. ACS4331]|uniref:AAA family ATPase n=1 Tax=Mycobacterium sp. ACS4331 TaxID=1834121 RepID=UPI0007FD2687|nr:AAA family ATPase [Mycobacterium sp. ACS4331]OBF29865.1 AAA family ATPase [Mycobacterium sp. ACS4331]